MKEILILSDSHGCYPLVQKAVEAQPHASGIIFLGDGLKDIERLQAEGCTLPVYAVRGNCDTEVDQMVLEFPILADYAFLLVEGQASYATHGHIFHENHLPPVQDGDVLIHGHTHLLEAKEICTEDGRRIKILNPGSVSIPKGGNPATYGILEDGVFSILDLENREIRRMEL